MNPAELVCCACGSLVHKRVARLESEIDGKEYAVLKCAQCGLISSFPLPDLSFTSLQKVYGPEYTDEQRRLTADHESDQALWAATHKQMEVVEKHVRVGTALNVGAMGRAIGALEERGWKLDIVEVSEHAAETARRLWGYRVIVSRIEDFASTGSYDFVKLGHVIEHVVDPRAVVRKAWELLRPGGIMLVDTDNFLSLRTQIELVARRLLGEQGAASLVKALTGKNLRKRYGRLTPPEHIYVFSEGNLTELLESVGFTVVQVFKPAWGDPIWFPLPRNMELSFIERVFIGVDQIGARLGLGEVLAVLAQKP